MGEIKRNRIKQLRLEKHMSQMELARYMNISQGTLSNWQVGRHDPGSDDLIKLANYFGVSTDYLLGKSDDPDSGTSYETPLILKSQQALLDIMEGLSDEKKERLLELAEMLKTVEAVEKDKDKNKK